MNNLKTYRGNVPQFEIEMHYLQSNFHYYNCATEYEISHFRLMITQILIQLYGFCVLFSLYKESR